MSFNIVIAYHSSDINTAYFLVDILKKSQLNEIYLIDEQKPNSIEKRYDYLKQSSAFIVLSSREYLREQFCMELVNFARDLKKEIFSINTCISFRPFGALGAIIAASGNQTIEIENEQTKEKELEKLVLTLRKLQTDSISASNDLTRPKTANIFDLKFSDQKIDVLISYHPKQELNARLLEKGLQNSDFSFKLEDSSSPNSCVKCCRILLIVMSDEYENSDVCKSVVDLARTMKKKIIPVAIKRGWKSNHWLGLVIAGKLFFRVISQDQLFKKESNFEFSPMDEILLEVSKSLKSRPDLSEREIAFKDALEKRIEECKQKLCAWPPPHRTRVKKELKPVKIVLNKPYLDENEYYPNQHFTVGRAFIVPDTLYDNFGVPKRQKFDAMISYQWAHQDLVKKVFMNLHMKYLSIWFDVWGYMEGCTYDAMATAIECSKVIVVFLSNKYQSSANCQLEFKYAIARGKPFIFILVEENLIVQEWIRPYFDESVKFELKSVEDQNIIENGLPRLHTISQAIRDIGFAQMENQDELFEFSDETIKLKEILDDALDEIDALNGTSRFKECTRCHKKFDENDNKMDCFKHQYYYIKYWTCCGQLDVNSIGCASTTHTHLQREFIQDSYYGTFTWNPA